MLNDLECAHEQNRVLAWGVRGVWWEVTKNEQNDQIKILVYTFKLKNITSQTSGSSVARESVRQRSVGPALFLVGLVAVLRLALVLVAAATSTSVGTSVPCAVATPGVLGRRHEATPRRRHHIRVNRFAVLWFTVGRFTTLWREHFSDHITMAEDGGRGVNY